METKINEKELRRIIGIYEDLLKAAQESLDLILGEVPPYRPGRMERLTAALNLVSEIRGERGYYQHLLDESKKGVSLQYQTVP